MSNTSLSNFQVREKRRNMKCEVGHETLALIIYPSVWRVYPIERHESSVRKSHLLFTHCLQFDSPSGWKTGA